MNAAARSIVGLGLTEGFAAQLTGRFALHQPSAVFDPDAAVVVQDARVDEPEMARQPGLKFIAVFGVGYDRVDLAAAKARGIVLANVVLAPHVAGSTHETWNEAAALLMNNLDHFFTTGLPLTPIAL